MQKPALTVTRMPQQFISDDRRVITRLFIPGGEARIPSILERVSGLSDQEVRGLLARVIRDFATRHRDIEGA